MDREDEAGAVEVSGMADRSVLEGELQQLRVVLGEKASQMSPGKAGRLRKELRWSIELYNQELARARGGSASQRKGAQGATPVPDPSISPPTHPGHVARQSSVAAQCTHRTPVPPQPRFPKPAAAPRSKASPRCVANIRGVEGGVSSSDDEPISPKRENRGRRPRPNDSVGSDGDRATWMSMFGSENQGLAIALQAAVLPSHLPDASFASPSQPPASRHSLPGIVSPPPRTHCSPQAVLQPPNVNGSIRTNRWSPPSSLSPQRSLEEDVGGTQSWSVGAAELREKMEADINAKVDLLKRLKHEREVLQHNAHLQQQTQALVSGSVSHLLQLVADAAADCQWLEGCMREGIKREQVRGAQIVLLKSEVNVLQQNCKGQSPRGLQLLERLEAAENDKTSLLCEVDTLREQLQGMRQACRKPEEDTIWHQTSEVERTAAHRGREVMVEELHTMRQSPHEARQELRACSKDLLVAKAGLHRRCSSPNPEDREMAQTEEGQKVKVFSGSSRTATGAAERDAETVPGDRRDLHLEIVQLKAEVERLEATAAATSRAAMLEGRFAEITAENKKLKQEIEELKVLASKATGGEIREITDSCEGTAEIHVQTPNHTMDWLANMQQGEDAIGDVRGIDCSLSMSRLSAGDGAAAGRQSGCHSPDSLEDRVAIDAPHAHDQRQNNLADVESFIVARDGSATPPGSPSPNVASAASEQDVLPEQEVLLHLKLDVDVGHLGADGSGERAAFETQLLLDICTAARVSSAHVSVRALSPCSGVATIAIHARAQNECQIGAASVTVDPEAVSIDLERQMGMRHSLLRAGVWTRCCSKLGRISLQGLLEEKERFEVEAAVLRREMGMVVGRTEMLLRQICDAQEQFAEVGGVERFAEGLDEANRLEAALESSQWERDRARKNWEMEKEALTAAVAAAGQRAAAEQERSANGETERASLFAALAEVERLYERERQERDAVSRDRDNARILSGRLEKDMLGLSRQLLALENELRALELDLVPQVLDAVLATARQKLQGMQDERKRERAELAEEIECQRQARVRLQVEVAQLSEEKSALQRAMALTTAREERGKREVVAVLEDLTKSFAQMHGDLAAAGEEIGLLRASEDTRRAKQEEEVLASRALADEGLRELDAMKLCVVDDLRTGTDAPAAVRQERDELGVQQIVLDRAQRSQSAALELAMRDATLRQGAGVLVDSFPHNAEILTEENALLRNRMAEVEADRADARREQEWLSSERVHDLRLAEAIAVQVEALQNELCSLRAALAQEQQGIPNEGAWRAWSRGEAGGEMAALAALLSKAEEACKRERAKAADATAAKAEAEAEVQGALQERKALEQEVAEWRAAVAERDEHASRLAARMQIALSKTHIRGVPVVESRSVARTATNMHGHEGREIKLMDAGEIVECTAVGDEAGLRGELPGPGERCKGQMAETGLRMWRPALPLAEDSPESPKMCRSLAGMEEATEPSGTGEGGNREPPQGTMAVMLEAAVTAVDFSLDRAGQLANQLEILRGRLAMSSPETRACTLGVGTTAEEGSESCAMTRPRLSLSRLAMSCALGSGPALPSTPGMNQDCCLEEGRPPPGAREEGCGVVHSLASHPAAARYDDASGLGTLRSLLPPSPAPPEEGGGSGVDETSLSELLEAGEEAMQVLQRRVEALHTEREAWLVEKGALERAVTAAGGGSGDAAVSAMLDTVEEEVQRWMSSAHLAVLSLEKEGKTTSSEQIRTALARWRTLVVAGGGDLTGSDTCDTHSTTSCGESRCSPTGFSRVAYGGVEEVALVGGLASAAVRSTERLEMAVTQMETIRECCALALMLSRQRQQHLAFERDSAAAVVAGGCAAEAREIACLECGLGGVEEALQALAAQSERLRVERRRQEQAVCEGATELQCLQQQMAAALLWAAETARA